MTDKQTDSDVPIQERIRLPVIVVFSERIQHRLGDLEPAHVEDELDDTHDGEVDIDLE